MELESLQQKAEREKAYSAEENVAFARLFVVPFNTFLFLFMDASKTIPWLAYLITVIAWIYTAYIYFFKPYKKYPVLLSSSFSSISDGVLIILWIYSTGAFFSPFYPLWYISIIAIAFRFSIRLTFLSAFLYSVLYLTLITFLNQLDGHEVEVFNRIGYIFLIGFVAILITKETLEKTQEKILMAELVRETRKSQNKLAKSEELLKEAQAIAKLGSWEWNIKKNVLSWSAELYNIAGLPIDSEVDYKKYLSVIHPSDRENVKNTIAKAIENKSDFKFEHRLIQPSGEIKILLSRGRVVANKEGEPFKLVGTALDVTEIKNTKEELKLRDQFIGLASHELKTPLTSVKAYIQLLGRHLQKVDETGTEYVNKAIHHINRLNNLISDLLDVSKIQGGKLQFNISEFNFDEMIREGVEGIQHTEPSHKIIFDGSTNAVIKGDKNRLEQVLINFLTNAIKYSPEAKTVKVRIEKRNENVVVAVTDYGVGVSAKNKKRIFEKFYRVQDVSHKFSGLGIGLYISSEIIKRHHGKIWVESEEGKGSTFYFSVKAENS